MPFVRSCAAWLRHHLRWSNSRQSWEERLAGLVLLAGAAALIGLGGRLSAAGQAVLWGLLLLALAVLLRRGWLKLFGPVLFYDLVRTGRQSRHFIIRGVYALFLLFILSSVYLSEHPSSSMPGREAARFAEQFFSTFMTVQLVVVALLTPAYVAGSIADEKDRKTLEFLLATDLRNREIVLSKLGSRLANVSLFVLTGLPVLALVQFMGGVDPGLVLAGFAATAMTMLGLAGLSILNSVLIKKPRDAIALTYLGAVGYLLLSFMSLLLPPAVMQAPLSFGSDPLTVGGLVNAFNSGNLFLALRRVQEAGYRGTLADDLGEILSGYALFHGLVAAGCIAWAVVRLRAVALKQAHGTTQKERRSPLGRGRPAVGEQPMVWKEVHVEGGVRLNWLALVVVVLLVIATFLPAVFILYDHQSNRYARPWSSLGRDMNVWVRSVGTIVACLTLLAVAVRASSSVSGERDRQTLDALLTSPLDSDAILYAKWLGSVLSVRRAWVWLGLIWGVGVLSGGLNPLGLPLLLLSWAVYAATLALIGLCFSVTSHTTQRATLWTLLVTLGVSVGHWLPWMCCGFFMRGPGAEHLLMFQAGLTPPYVLGWFAFHGEEFSRDFAGHYAVETTVFNLGGLFLWALGASMLWASVSGHFRTVTGRGTSRGTDHALGRYRPRALPPRLEPGRHSEPEEAVLLEEEWERPPDPGREEEPPEDETTEAIRPRP
jgi:ABC-type transport system involved in multi-copper enzyme maturation permease subunit